MKSKMTLALAADRWHDRNRGVRYAAMNDRELDAVLTNARTLDAALADLHADATRAVAGTKVADPCDCDLRVRQWNPGTGKCETCGRRYVAAYPRLADPEPVVTPHEDVGLLDQITAAMGVEERKDDRAAFSEPNHDHGAADDTPGARVIPAPGTAPQPTEVHPLCDPEDPMSEFDANGQA